MARIGFPISCSQRSGQARVSARKRQLTRFIVGLFSLVFTSLAIAAPAAVDPVFGLVYAPEKVKFTPAPAGLLAACPALANAHWTRELWIYAEDQTPDGTYLVIGGFYAAKPPAPAKLETDPMGAVIETTTSGCMLLGPAREVFQYPEGLIPTPVLQELAHDLVHRYRAAFGGAAALQTALRTQHAAPTSARDSALRDALSSKAP